MYPQELIRRKRDGATLTSTEIRDFVAGLSDGTMSEAQVAAFAMAVFFRGMDAQECRTLTMCMKDSGKTMEWAGWRLPGPIVDKHSTGGVGDKVSLILAPLLASCGGIVPMIAGRGLGHTGGTIDKLEAIPGYETTADQDHLGHVLRTVGCAIMGQTEELAPADRRFYAIRDVTATVESIPLITASILSKKLAAGLEHLAIDLKVGNGAFASDLAMGRALGRSLVEVAGRAGLPTVAHLTDMNQVLGWSAGNALEVAESIAFMAGDAQEPRLRALTLTLAAELLTLSGLVPSFEKGLAQADAALQRGDALERFAKMVHAMGGPSDLVHRPDRLGHAPVIREVFAPTPGYLRAIDTRAVGLVVMTLGGGRRHTSDRIQPHVGIDQMASLGTQVGPGERPLCRIFAMDTDAAAQAEQAMLAAVAWGDEPPSPSPLLLERIDSTCLS